MKGRPRNRLLQCFQRKRQGLSYFCAKYFYHLNEFCKQRYVTNLMQYVKQYALNSTKLLRTFEMRANRTEISLFN